MEKQAHDLKVELARTKEDVARDQYCCEQQLSAANLEVKAAQASALYKLGQCRELGNQLNACEAVLKEAEAVARSEKESSSKLAGAHAELASVQADIAAVQAQLAAAVEESHAAVEVLEMRLKTANDKIVVDGHVSTSLAEALNKALLLLNSIRKSLPAPPRGGLYPLESLPGIVKGMQMKITSNEGKYTEACKKKESVLEQLRESETLRCISVSELEPMESKVCSNSLLLRAAKAIEDRLEVGVLDLEEKLAASVARRAQTDLQLAAYERLGS